MKVLYITSLIKSERNGAWDHVNEIVNGLIKEGLNVKIISPSVRRNGLFDGINRKIEVSRLTKAALHNFHPEIVYFRYEGGDILSIHEIIKESVPYVLELNTRPLDEMYATKRITLWMASLMSEPYIINHANGIAAISNEIYQYASRFTKKPKPFLLAKNGVDIKEVKFFGYNPSIRGEFETPKNNPLLVVVGSLALWHGLDILLEALSEPCLSNFYLWIIGKVDKNYIEGKSRNSEVLKRIRIIPWKLKADLGRILSAADIGVGSLALHRNHMLEGQPLKVRLYLASGLPTFVGYKDAVIPDDCNFISSGNPLYVPNLAYSIKIFYDRIKHDRIDIGKEARRFAENKLTWDIAAKETAIFLKDIYQNRINN